MVDAADRYIPPVRAVHAARVIDNATGAHIQRVFSEAADGSIVAHDVLLAEGSVIEQTPSTVGDRVFYCDDFAQGALGRARCSVSRNVNVGSSGVLVPWDTISQDTIGLVKASSTTLRVPPGVYKVNFFLAYVRQTNESNRFAHYLRVLLDGEESGVIGNGRGVHVNDYTRNTDGSDHGGLWFSFTTPDNRMGGFDLSINMFRETDTNRDVRTQTSPTRDPGYIEFIQLG